MTHNEFWDFEEALKHFCEIYTDRNDLGEILKCHKCTGSFTQFHRECECDPMEICNCESDHSNDEKNGSDNDSDGSHEEEEKQDRPSSTKRNDDSDSDSDSHSDSDSNSECDDSTESMNSDSSDDEKHLQRSKLEAKLFKNWEHLFKLNDRGKWKKIINKKHKAQNHPHTEYDVC